MIATGKNPTDDVRHGGIYREQEIREVVSYEAARGVLGTQARTRVAQGPRSTECVHVLAADFWKLADRTRL
jgi:hypothetical protein